MVLSDFVKRIGEKILNQAIRESLKKIFPRKRNKSDKQEQPPQQRDAEPLKSHPWRLCPIGQHWVQTHPLTVPARGLIQITESTRKILQNQKGELKDHHIEMTAEESREPEVSIGAGVRWLHHKKKLAQSRLRGEITWEEAVAEYKGILSDLGKDPKSDEIMVKLSKYHKKLKDLRQQKK